MESWIVRQIRPNLDRRYIVSAGVVRIDVREL